MLFFMAAMGQSSVRIVYVKHEFNWDSAVIGIYDGLEGLVIALSMVFAPTWLQKVMKFCCKAGTDTHIKLITWIQIGYFVR